MAVNLSPVGGVAAQFFTNSGAPLTGGKIFTYAAGTTTPQASYTTSQGNVAWTNPIVLDAAGRVPSGGEIWLTDGLIYKFILKDANDVLIATYDNITGINSNSVAFVNQQEIVTATAGQTVFNLGISYQPGTNSLSVFVDGVNQYGPGAQYSYVETDSNTVTFNAGLHVGAEVKFTTTQQQGAGAVDASQVTYDPPFTGSVATNVEAKLAQTVSVKDFGAVGDGDTLQTDDTSAIQAALNATPKYGTLYFPPGTYMISGQLSIPNDNVTLIGSARIKAADNTNFTTMLTAANRSNVVINGLTFDANKAGRSSGQNVAFSGLNFNFSVDCSIINCTIKNTLGYGGASTVGVAVSGSAQRFTARGCRFIDCGDTATNLPSDGIFIRGDYCVVENCYAKNVTDTAFVLEGCNYSRVSSCVVDSSTGFAAITNDTSSDCAGNMIDGLTGSCDYVGSTGGIIAVGCFGAGNVRESTVSNVSIRGLSGAGGLGPAIQIRTTSTGRVIGLTANNVSIDYGAATGAFAQGFLVSDSDDIQINNAYIKLQTGVGATGIRFDGTCVNGIVNGGFIDGATTGVSVLNTSAAIIQNAVFKNQTEYCIAAANSATVIENQNYFSSFGIAALNKGVSATLKSQFWQSWTPTYATDIGNAATSFTGTPTTTLARISRSGNVASVTVNYSATLQNISPTYVELTLPFGCSPSNSTTYSPASVLNDATYETGVVRTLTGTDKLLVYRANGVTYSANANVEGRFSLTFEATN
jgi:hypothetical protein